MTNVVFDDVEKPFDIRGAAEVRATGTRITNAPRPPNLNSRRTMVGYTGRNGPPLPAYCPKCHSVFPSINYDIGSSLFYGMDNEETCQNTACGYEHAKLADGLFDLAKQTVVVLQSGQLTYAMLQAIQAASQDFLTGKTDAEATLEKIDGISSTIGKFFRAAWGLGVGAAGLFALWFVVFPSHLSAVQSFFGEEQDGTRRSYEIEKVCLDAFGEAARCKFILSDESGRAKSKKVKAVKKNSEPDHHAVLPLNGPTPAQKPLQQNRHERRKAAKLSRPAKK